MISGSRRFKEAVKSMKHTYVRETFAGDARIIIPLRAERRLQRGLMRPLLAVAKMIGAEEISSAVGQAAENGKGEDYSPFTPLCFLFSLHRLRGKGCFSRFAPDMPIGEGRFTPVRSGVRSENKVYTDISLEISKLGTWCKA